MKEIYRIILFHSIRAPVTGFSFLEDTYSTISQYLSIIGYNDSCATVSYSTDTTGHEDYLESLDPLPASGLDDIIFKEEPIEHRKNDLKQFMNMKIKNTY